MNSLEERIAAGSKSRFAFEKSSGFRKNAVRMLAIHTSCLNPVLTDSLAQSFRPHAKVTRSFEKMKIVALASSSSTVSFSCCTVSTSASVVAVYF